MSNVRNEHEMGGVCSTFGREEKYSLHGIGKVKVFRYKPKRLRGVPGG